MQWVRRAPLSVVLLTLLLPAGGCAVVGDLFDPQFLTSVGVDPIAVNPPTGTVIVVVENTTPYVAEFDATYSTSSGTGGYISKTVNPAGANGDIGNSVLDCPVDFITLGTSAIGNGGALNSGLVGATIFNPEGAATATYEGSVMRNGRDFVCGDVIYIQIISQIDTDGDTATVEYSFVIQIIPGQ